MNPAIAGIHHVTAIAGDAQRNVDFYTGLLGLRLVKKTVNFDDPYTYHFYYGAGDGQPGSILTFFPWSGGSAGGRALQGRVGAGQVVAIRFSVPLSSVSFWRERLKEAGVSLEESAGRSGGTVLRFRAPDGIPLSLAAGEDECRPGWENGVIPAQDTVRGFHSVTLHSRSRPETARLLTAVLGCRQVEETGGVTRFAVGDGGPGKWIDLVQDGASAPGSMGVGAVHHLAWRVADEAQQLRFREELLLRGYQVTPVQDRRYFRSIYFREPGGILFEIATDPPGFTVDEAQEELGTHLQLPPWLEAQRLDIEKRLPLVII